MAKSINIGLILIALGFSLFLLGCADISGMTFRGTDDDMFVDTSVKDINIPIWTQVVGMIVYFVALVSSTVSQIKKIRYKPVKAKVVMPISVVLLLKFLILLSVFTLTGLFGFLSIAMEVLGHDAMSMTLLTLQMMMLVLAIFSAFIRFGNNLSEIDMNSVWLNSISGFAKALTKGMHKVLEKIFGINNVLDKQNNGDEL